MRAVLLHGRIGCLLVSACTVAPRQQDSAREGAVIERAFSLCIPKVHEALQSDGTGGAREYLLATSHSGKTFGETAGLDDLTQWVAPPDAVIGRLRDEGLRVSGVRSGRGRLVLEDHQWFAWVTVIEWVSETRATVDIGVYKNGRAAGGMVITLIEGTEGWSPDLSVAPSRWVL